MDSEVSTLKAVVIEFICKNFDTIFYKKLHRIQNYLKENECDDCTEFYIGNQEWNYENNKNNNRKTDTISVLQDFVKSHQFPEILWKETTVKKGSKIRVGLKISDVVVEVNDTVNRQDRAKSIAAQLMVKKLYSKFLSDPILNNYCKQELAHKRHHLYDTESVFRTVVPACTVNAVDELQGYEFTENERWEMLQNIPEYKLRRSHMILMIHPDSQQLDFSFCPALFSPKFLELLLMKAKKVRSINLQGCSKSVSSVDSVISALKKCQDTLHYFNINGCGDVNSENVFRALRKYNIPLKQLSVDSTFKKNAMGSREFQRYFTTKFGRLLLSLDLSGITLCEDELHFLLNHCKKLLVLKLEETLLNSNCYCVNHSINSKPFDRSAITRLKELNLNQSQCKDKLLRVLVDHNKGLEQLSIASLTLTPFTMEPVELRHLEHLSTLDISFLGNGAYEDFAVYEQELSRSLRWLKLSGYCGVDISHLSVTCPYLTTLIINTSVVDLSITRSMVEDFTGKFVSVPHSIQNFTHLRRLELRYTNVNLLSLLECHIPLPLQELIIEGELLDDDSLTYIVNSKCPTSTGRMEHIFRSLNKLHICNCNNVTDFGVEHADFGGLPALKDLIIERCSRIKRYKLTRLQQILRPTHVSLTSFVHAERPNFIARKEIEIVMG